VDRIHKPFQHDNMLSVSFFFNFKLCCVCLTHRGYDPLDMELVNTENKVTNIIHDVRYNTINFRIQLSRHILTMAYNVQGGSNMTGTCAACLHTNQSRSYLNHLVYSK
jgi:hypothetical protein